jgi:hypothetical protein
MKNAHKIFVAKREGNRPLGRPSLRWKNNIRTDLKEVGWKDVDWMHMTQITDK